VPPGPALPAAFSVNVRIPAWAVPPPGSEGVVISVNGSPLPPAAPGSYLRIPGPFAGGATTTLT
jgi:hypothetical protein